jgi:hypothetical protein
MVDEERSRDGGAMEQVDALQGMMFIAAAVRLDPGNDPVMGDRPE